MGLTDMHDRLRRLPILLIAAGLASCMGYGPRTIERDQMDYGLSISSALQQQLLGNIVRLRYMEAPVFVNVSSVINQYSLSGQVEGKLVQVVEVAGTRPLRRIQCPQFIDLARLGKQFQGTTDLEDFFTVGGHSPAFGVDILAAGLRPERF